MNALTRVVLTAGLLATLVALSGCAPSSEDLSGDGPVPVPTPNTRCTVDQDCPSASLFICNTAVSLCEAACRTREDCGVARRGAAFTLSECDGNPLGCECDANRCVPSLCSADADCSGGFVCRNGLCGQPPPAASAASCRVVPDVLIGRAGERVRFDVLATDAAGQPLVTGEGATWTALGPAVKGEGKGAGMTFTLEVPGAAVEAVQAQVGEARCRARVTVLPAVVPAGQVRAVVTDELTGRPVAGALVVASDSQGAVTASAPTDAGGVALVAAQGVVTVSVFHADFGYLTVVRYDAAAGSRHLALTLRRNPEAHYGGYRGTFRNPPATSNLHVGVASLSIPGLATELSGAQLVGPSRPVSFNLLGQVRQTTLPAGAFVTLGADPVQTEVSAQGVAGVCDARLTGAEDPEAAILSGACGTRSAWALAGDVPLSELPPSIFGPAPDLNQLLAQSIPLLRRFQSSVVRDVQFRLKPTPVDAAGAPDFRDMAHFTALDHDFQQLRLGFHFAVRVPELPRYRNAYLDSATVLGAASVPGRGLVPLGLGMAVNTTPADPKTDTQAGLPSPGLVSVRMAPAHHGLEGSPYRLLVLATSNAATTDASAGVASSALLEPLPGDSLPFDPKGAAPVALAGTFLPIPEGARYNFEPTAYRGLEGRQLRFLVAPELPGATLLRAVFSNRAGRRWTVVMDPAQATNGFRLPVPPAPFEDRTFFGDITGSRSRLMVQALSARNPDGGALGLAALVESRDAAERLAERIRAFSLLDAGRPEVAWVFPAEEGGRVAPGGIVRVRVSAFKPGSAPTDDGYVRLSFVGGTGCEGETARGDVDVSQGLGEVELRLPPGCTGSGVQLTATLVDPEGTPLRPAVSSTRAVNVLP
jgi:hypothetical protein